MASQSPLGLISVRGWFGFRLWLTIMNYSRANKLSFVSKLKIILGDTLSSWQVLQSPVLTEYVLLTVGRRCLWTQDWERMDG